MSSAANRQQNNPQALRQKPVPKTNRAAGSGQVIGSSIGGSTHVQPSNGAEVTGSTVGGKNVRDMGSRGKNIST
jgi:hypothetical protein